MRHMPKKAAKFGMPEFDKLLLETEPVAHGNNVVLTSKLCPQISFMPYSTDNCSIRGYEERLNCKC